MSDDSANKNNIQNTYEYMNEKSFERNPELFESDPIESGCDTDSQPEIVKVELDIPHSKTQQRTISD